MASFVGTLNLVNAGVDRRLRPGALSIDGQEIRTSKVTTDASDDGRVTLALRPEGIALGEGDPGSNRLTGTVEDINFLGSIVRIRVRLGEDEGGEPPTIVALDTFNEPHLRVPDVGQPRDRSRSRPRRVRARRGARRGGDPELGGRRGGVTVRLDGIELVIFDKDGTLIEFGPMWSGWAETLAAVARGGHRPADRDPAVRDARLRPRRRGTVLPGGGLAATPMARLRERTGAVLERRGRRTARPRSERSTPPGTRRTRSSWPGR